VALDGRTKSPQLRRMFSRLCYLALLLGSFEQLPMVSTQGDLVTVPLEKINWTDTGAELYVAKVKIGSPPQEVYAYLDSGSPISWIPTHSGPGFEAFDPNISRSGDLADIKDQAFSMGLTDTGHLAAMMRDEVSLGDAWTIKDAPFMVVGELPGTPKRPEGVGRLGLIPGRPYDSQPESLMQSLRLRWGEPLDELNEFGFLRMANKFIDDTADGSLAASLFKQGPSLHHSYRLELGGTHPRLTIGEWFAQEHKPGGSLRMLSNMYTKRTSLWYTSLRAIGLGVRSSSESSTEHILLWNHDFNSLQPLGVPTRLDSGATGIAVSTKLYNGFIGSLPYECTWKEWSKTTVCHCSKDYIDEEFPTISLSFEAAETYRTLGFDSGDEVRVCIPPSAYVRYNKTLDSCFVDVVNAGQQGLENIVLGAPFFRSSAVLIDIDRSMIALDRLEGQPVCDCADPKNWWQTGTRWSAKRAWVCLVIFLILTTYIYVGYSHSVLATTIRETLEANCPGLCDTSGRPPDGWGLGGYQEGFASAPLGFLSGGGTQGAGADPPTRTESRRNRRERRRAAAAAAATEQIRDALLGRQQPRNHWQQQQQQVALYQLQQQRQRLVDRGLLSPIASSPLTPPFHEGRAPDPEPSRPDDEDTYQQAYGEPYPYANPPGQAQSSQPGGSTGDNAPTGFSAGPSASAAAPAADEANGPEHERQHSRWRWLQGSQQLPHNTSDSRQMDRRPSDSADHGL